MQACSHSDSVRVAQPPTECTYGTLRALQLAKSSYRPWKVLEFYCSEFQALESSGKRHRSRKLENPGKSWNYAADAAKVCSHGCVALSVCERIFRSTFSGSQSMSTNGLHRSGKCLLIVVSWLSLILTGVRRRVHSLTPLSHNCRQCCRLWSWTTTRLTGEGRVQQSWIKWDHDFARAPNHVDTRSKSSPGIGLSRLGNDSSRILTSLS